MHDLAPPDLETVERNRTYASVKDGLDMFEGEELRPIAETIVSLSASSPAVSLKECSETDLRSLSMKAVEIMYEQNNGMLELTDRYLEALGRAKLIREHSKRPLRQLVP